VTLRKASAIAVFAAPLFVAACTFLVKFDDKDPDDEDAGSSESDDGGVVVRPDATPPADAPVSTNPCSGVADSTNFDPSDRTLRCCNGQPVRVSANENCGACGLRCGVGQHCELKSDHYYCVGCVSGTLAVDEACAPSTHCCSKQFDARGLCAASTCVVSGASCNQIVCPNGATCLQPSGASYVCSYWP
jgi:hypothetical protein